MIPDFTTQVKNFSQQPTAYSQNHTGSPLAKVIITRKEGGSYTTVWNLTINLTKLKVTVLKFACHLFLMVQYELLRNDSGTAEKPLSTAIFFVISLNYKLLFLIDFFIQF